MVSNPKAKGRITKHPNRGSGQPEIELRADGWERFRRAVAAAAKSGPKHRPAKKQNQSKKTRLEKFLARGVYACQ
jgi:hypothetical protein